MTNNSEVSLLLVEDDDIDAMAIQRAFNKMRIANPMYRARNGIEALSMLRGDEPFEKISRPYIILLDLNMPQMNGIEFLHEIRNDKALHDSIVFVLTTSSADEDRSEAYLQNIAGYIIKAKVADDFTNVLSMLNHYWRIIELPS